jgi:hypothetical protein
LNDAKDVASAPDADNHSHVGESVNAARGEIQNRRGAANGVEVELQLDFGSGEQVSTRSDERRQSAHTSRHRFAVFRTLRYVAADPAKSDATAGLKAQVVLSDGVRVRKPGGKPAEASRIRQRAVGGVRR